MAFPDFALLSSAFPDYWKFPEAVDARNYVGGEAKEKDITNTCTIRLSYAMNGVDVPIPKYWKGITNRKGKNGKFHIIRVKDFRTWMESQFGKPEIDHRKKTGGKYDLSRIKGMRGVIAFDFGIDDSNAHFDLWYRDKFSHEHNAGGDFFVAANRISLWTDGTRVVSPEV